MEDANQTSVMRVCGACSADLLERDKYCRRCGLKQPSQQSQFTSRNSTGLSTESITPVEIATGAVAINGATASRLIDPLLTMKPAVAVETSALPDAPEANPYHRVSGPLVEAVAVGLAANAFSKFQNQFVRQSFSLLLSIPIWLMIILLSPFDAYIAAKNISSQGALK